MRVAGTTSYSSMTSQGVRYESGIS